VAFLKILIVTVVSLVSNTLNLACEARMCLRCRISTLAEEISFEDHLQKQKQNKTKKKTEEETLMQVGIVNSLADTYVYLIDKHCLKVKFRYSFLEGCHAFIDSVGMSEQKENANYDASCVNFAFAKFPPLTWTKPLGCTMKLPAQTGSCRLKHTCT